MPLPKQIVDLPLAVGIDQASDEKIAKGLLDLVNGEILKSGAITKRAGFSALGTAVKNGGIVEPDMPSGLRPDAASSLTKGFRLYSRGEQLVVSGFDSPDGGADANGHTGCIQTAYQPDVDQHTPCGLGTPCSFTVQHTGPGTLNEANPNMATGRGYRVYLADDGTNTSIKVLRAETGEVVHQLTTAGICGKGAFVGAAGSEKYIGYVLTSTGLSQITWDADAPLTPPVVAAVSFTYLAAAADPGASDVFDVCQTADGVNLLLAYTCTVAMSTAVIIREVDNSGVEQRTAFGRLVGGTAEAVSTFQVGEKVILAYSFTSTRMAHVLSSGAAFTEDTSFSVNPSSAPIVQIGGVQFPGSTSFLLFRTVSYAASAPLIPYAYYNTYYDVYTLTGTKYIGAYLKYVSLYAKPFVYEGRAYAACVPSDAIAPPTYMLLSFQRQSLASTSLAFPRLAAKAISYRAGGPRNYGLSLTTDEGDGLFSFAALREEAVVDAAATLESTVGISLQLHAAPPSALSFGGNTIVPGSVVSQLDGYYDDIGFPFYPYVSYAAGTASIAGTYNYCVVMEWTDRSGHIHRTGATLPHETTAGTLDITVYFPVGTQPHRLAFPGITAAIYRTENGGDTFYRTKTATLDTGDYLAGATVADDTTDADLIKNEPLYTNSGELEVDTPPPSGIMGASHNRLFAVPYDDPTSLWFTKPLADPYAPEFSAAQYISIPTGGDITGFAFLDGQHLVFKHSSIWRFVGDGPDALGVGTFSQPSELSTRVGCVDSHSLAVFDDGVMFRSAAGWQLLDRSMNVQPVGLPVSDYADRSVAHSFTVPKRQQLWFLLEHQAGDTDTTVLVYDYLKRIWWRHAIPGTVVDMLYNGDDLVYYLTSAGVIYQQGVTASTTDALTIDTPWYKGQSIQGYMRLWWVHLLGDLDDSFTVKVYYDYKDAPTDYVQTVSVPAEAGRKMVRVKPALHKFTSFRLQITVPALSDITLNALALVATSKGRGAPLLKARTL